MSLININQDDILENETIYEQSSSQDKLSNLKTKISSQIIGQEDLIESLLICLLCNGHAIVEGMPGLAKTRAAKSLATGIEAGFHRIQFTPDLLPSDLTGTDIYVEQQGEFSFKPGPIFQNILLADEINRAPAKVQSALLEAMEERQVTVGHASYKLPDLFMVIATQNPIEQEGTYNLPEAQLDRFLMHIKVDYPSHNDELSILNLAELETINSGSKVGTRYKLTTVEEVLSSIELVNKVYLDEKLKHYIVSIVQATREPEKYSKDIDKYLNRGVSIRASIAIMKAAKAYAWLNNKDFVAPSDIQHVVPNILRHRIELSYEADVENISKDDIIASIIQQVAVP